MPNVISKIKQNSSDMNEIILACGGRGVCGVCGGVEVWAFWGCGVTPYVRHSSDCTCCDFGHLRFYYYDNAFSSLSQNVLLRHNWPKTELLYLA
jgi:hypothetical protein